MSATSTARPAQPAAPQPVEIRDIPALAGLTDPKHVRWVAWDYEWIPGRNGKHGKWTKVPKQPDGRNARSNDPKTWHSYDDIWPLVARGQFGGIGLMLLGLPGDFLAMVDLDDCRDPQTGTFIPWTERLIHDSGSYAEITPSGCGARLIGSAAEIGKIHRRKTHPKGGAFELFIDCERFVTVTGHAVNGVDRLADITPQFRELMALLDAKPGNGSQPGDTGNDDGAEHIDLETLSPVIVELLTLGTLDGAAVKKRGPAFLRVVRYLRIKGHSFAAILALFQAHPNGVHSKYATRLETELQRAWNKISEINPVKALIKEFNDRYAVVNESGKPCVYAPRHEPDLNRMVYDRMTTAGLKLLYANRFVEDGEDMDGTPKFRAAADVWLKHPDRQQFIRGVVFDPASRNSDPQVLNLWRGFAIEARAGSWAKLQEHILSNICGNVVALYEYLLDLMADMVQHPAKQGEVAIVMRGPEGCGKGTLANAMLRVFGQHGFAISNATHLVGRFNAHLRDCVLLFADEAFIPDDRQHVGVLKSIITEPYLTIEAKYANPIQAPNYLHVIMASNEDWVVPASLKSRRWFMLDVSDARVGDLAYFDAIYRELKQGGYAAMLHELQNRDLSGLNLRKVPVTDALQEQRKRSVDTITAWWLDCLHRGYVFYSRLGLEDHWQKWHDFLPTEVLFASYTLYSRDHHDRHPLSRELFGRWMAAIGAKRERRRKQAVGEHLAETAMDGRPFRIPELIEHDFPTGYAFGTLDEARAAFCSWSGLEVEWDASL
jgi:hypothetical protein